MLTFDLVHPQLLAALSRAGHGATVLLADGHYPASTAVGPNAEVIQLNLVPGIVDVPTVLTPLLAAAPWEAATVMQPPADEPEPAAVTAYRETLTGMEFRSLDRFEFYRAARSTDLAVVVVTADLRTYANLLLTVGVRQFN